MGVDKVFEYKKLTANTGYFSGPVNAGLIETVEETPDTVITLVSGKKIIVKGYILFYTVYMIFFVL